ncbi:MAG TPA: HD domain-containing phosphohydrolase [Candidatus Elarobacter sp.]|nr:HD domain-containing phosphohydrolase [Candidatus Elarobacter sp.]
MQLSVSARRGDQRLAYALNERTRELASAALDLVSPADRTVAAEILVMRFVERFAGSINAADWTRLLSWVDASCKRYAGILPVGTLVAAAAKAIAAELDDAPGVRLPAGELDVVCAEVERLAARPRLIRDAARHEALDEIDVALDDLLTRLDGADELTAEHSRAVSTWCARLAQRLALAKHDAIFVTRAGLVHDVGKLTTPSAILNAPRALDEEEMTIMRHHAVAGANIVSEIPLVAHLTPAVRNHHERFDGRGYPDGLRASTIPIATRIVTVADAFNAMIGRRPYRPPFSPAVALERLEANRGTQFDPIVVDAMIDVVTNRTAQQERV